MFMWYQKSLSETLKQQKYGLEKTEVIFHKTVDLYIKFFEPENGKVNFYKKKDIEI